MKVKVLLLLHAMVTLAAGIVLIVAPAAIPGTVNIHLAPGEYLLSYFLGAAELAIAFLSFRSAGIKNLDALRVIVWTFIVFHAATGLLEAYAIVQGSSIKLLANIVLRAIIIGLFYYYGLRKNSLIIKKNFN